MRVGRYLGEGRLAIVDEPAPELPKGGLLVSTLASGLCSGELMDWYMDKKVPHVLGHEICGEVVATEDPRFPVGSIVCPHHHAPCMQCERCARGLYVHCDQWRRTRILPGGMAELCAVPKENLADTLVVGDLRPVDAALIEPLGCVMKSIRLSGLRHGDRAAVIGLGVMGLLHMLMLPGAVGYDSNPRRVDWARRLGLDARGPEDSQVADVIYVCPGTQSALDFGIRLADFGATLVLFAPFAPGEPSHVPLSDLYFRDIKLVNSYSCGPDDVIEAAKAIRSGKVRAEQVVSDFIELGELPNAYLAMKRGEILKPMVLFRQPAESTSYDTGRGARASE